MIAAQIVADSSNEHGQIITTMMVTFPRFILAELNTHRMFSRNSASSRAIPFNKMVESVKNNPFIPMAWQKDHKGMQGTEYLDQVYEDRAVAQWLEARDNAVASAEHLSDGCSVTKQLVNRLLEPFMYHTVLITATEFSNFWALRCPRYEVFDNIIGSPTYTQTIYFRSKADAIKHNPEFANPNCHEFKSEWNWIHMNKGQAEIHMMALAEAMWDAFNESTPKELKSGELHIPFGDEMDEEQVMVLLTSKELEFLHEVPQGRPYSATASRIRRDNLLNPYKVKIATARCARVSYTVVGEEGKPANYENDIKLHDRLAESGHMSPFEHCAKAMSSEEYKYNLTQQNLNSAVRVQNGWCGNFRGFIQYRKTLSNENITI